MLQEKPFLSLVNPIKSYAWGHASLINDLLGLDSVNGQPQAELWMGAHPGGPSLVYEPGTSATEAVSLLDLIRTKPENLLGATLLQEGVKELPFLFKVLAADTPLSIQAHPSLAAAQIGFAAENAAGISLDDSRRNYKDANHKPEIICALSEFHGLAGFRPVADIRADFAELAAESANQVAGDFFQHLTTLGRTADWADASYWRAITEKVLNLQNQAGILDELIRHAHNRTESRWQWLAETALHYPGDKGLFFFLILQLHRLDPGQALCIPAGVMHAYLRGFGVELMANSDNVLRGGLTPKHVDVGELMKNLDWQATGIRIDPTQNSGRFDYAPFTWEFALSRISSPAGGEVRSSLIDSGPQIVLCSAGRVVFSLKNGQHVSIEKGQSLYLPPCGEVVEVQVNGELFVASVAVAQRHSGVFVGIDGGGTSTRVCLVDQDAKLLAIGRSGPSSIDTVSLAETEAAIKTALAQAQAQLQQAQAILGIVSGIGGTDTPQDEDRVSVILKRLPGLAPTASCRAVNDMKTALAAGTVLQPGIVCILGTGSVAYGRNAVGREHKSGGWGYKEGDPGSSYDLGISAIRSMVRAYDGRLEPSAFTKDIFQSLKLETIADITRILYRENLSRTEIAALAPIVTRWADAGEGRARAIVERAVAEVVETIRAVYEQLFKYSDASVPLAIVGSLGNSAGYYHDVLSASLTRDLPHITLQKAHLEPVVGAALWALQTRKGQIDPHSLAIDELQIL